MAVVQHFVIKRYIEKQFILMVFEKELLLIFELVIVDKSISNHF